MSDIPALGSWIIDTVYGRWEFTLEMKAVVFSLVLALAMGGCASGRLADPYLPGEDGAAPPVDQKSPPKKDGSVTPKPDKYVQPPKPDKSVPKPDKFVPKPDKFVPPPDQAPPKPDKFVPPPDQAPPKPDKGPTCPKVAFSSVFESNNGGLKSWGDWQWGLYKFAAGKNCDSSQNPPPKPHSGLKMWGTILNDCHSSAGNATAACNNTNPKNNSILRLEVKVPTGCKQAFVEWWEYNDYFLNFDWAEVRIDGKVIHQNCNSSTVPQKVWTKRVVNISSYLGKHIGLEFHFMATGVINYSGWYIDDVAVRVK